MARSGLAELETGEGKTMAATLPASEKPIRVMRLSGGTDRFTVPLILLAQKRIPKRGCP